MAGGEAAGKKSDLGLRTASAVVMVAVAGAALWLGGWTWTLFVALVAMGVLWEWRALVRGFAGAGLQRLAWNAGGFVYIAVAAGMLVFLRGDAIGAVLLLAAVLGVIATDIGAYFAGRAIGGPKIAPRISPSKTWAGLGGGIVGATLAGAALAMWGDSANSQFHDLGGGGINWLDTVLFGAIIAPIAQAGDFFESWMKRRAGVKDSSHLIPGHGGLFDRVDGLLAVCFVMGMILIGTVLVALATGTPLLPTPA